VYERRGEYAEAMRWLEQALSSLDRDASSHHAVERVRLYVDTGWVHFKRGNLDDAYRWLTRAVDTSAGSDYYAELGSAYNSLAALFQYKGDSTRAFEYAHKSLTLRETIGDTEGVSRSNSNVGAIAASRGEWNEAIHHLQRSLQLKQRIGDAKRLPLAYSNLGLLYVYKGDAAQARGLLGDGLKLAVKIHDPNQICLALNGLAQAELLEEQWSAAIELLTKSLESATQTGAKDQLADANWIMAEAELGAGHLEAAERYAREALQLAQEMGLRQYEASAFRVLGKIARLNEAWHESEINLSRSIAIFSELQNQFEAARSEFELARLYLAQGMNLDARALLERCLNTFSRLGASHFQTFAERALEQLEPIQEQTMNL
jgi:tetratricopeptide (TPR) repeat protein